MTRLAVLLTHPIQYFAPLMRRLATEPGIDLTVYYGSRMGVDVAHDTEFGRSFRWDVPLLEGYRSIFLPSVGADRGVHGFAQPFSPSIAAELRRNKFDALLIHGYASATNLVAVMAARIVGTKTLFRAEVRERATSRNKRLAKWMTLGLFFRTMIDAFLYIGTRSREYYATFNVSPSRLSFSPYCVDNDFFQHEAKRLFPERDSLRAQIGVHDRRPLILSVGKLIPKKRPLVLLQAFERMRHVQEAALVFVGDGQLRKEIEAEVQAAHIPDVHIAGFMNQSEISRAYVAADLLVLPSDSNETWGLVVNEAMNFGLPIVVSDQVGCAPDLVEPGRNGLVVPCDDRGALAEAIGEMAGNQSKRAQFGARSQEIIGGWSPEHASAAIASATVRLTTHRPTCASEGLG